MRDYKTKDLYPNKKVLSSTQVLNYLEDPFKFHLEWLLGMRKQESEAMIFGRIFSEAYADPGFDYRLALAEAGIPAWKGDLIQKALPFIQKCPPEYCEYEMKARCRRWWIRATLDGLKLEQHRIIENKTGAEGNSFTDFRFRNGCGYQVGWNQERCDTSEQITLQQWAFWKRIGIPPVETIVHFIPTSKNPKSPVQIFRTKRSITQLKLFEAKLEAVIRNIEAENWTEKIS